MSEETLLELLGLGTRLLSKLDKLGIEHQSVRVGPYCISVDIELPAKQEGREDRKFSVTATASVYPIRYWTKDVPACDGFWNADFEHCDKESAAYFFPYFSLLKESIDDRL